MVNPMIQSMRSAFHSLHYHAFWRHTTSAADPTNVVTVKKPICSRLFSIQTPPTNGKEPPVIIPFHVHSGLNTRLAVRSHHHHSIPPFALLTADQAGPDAEEEPFGTDPFYCNTRSLQYNALITVQSNESSESGTDSLNESEHEEKDNDHIVVQTKAIRRKSLVEKLQPIDSLYATLSKKSFNFNEQIQSERPFDLDAESTFDEPLESEKPVSFDEHFQVESSTNDAPHDEFVIDPSQFEPVYAPVTQATILALFADLKPVEKPAEKTIVTSPLETVHVDDHVEDQVHHFDQCRYFGRLVDGMPEGPGQMIYADNSVYYGTFRAGKCHGYGTFIWPDRVQYEGQFVNDLRHGYGVLRSVDGSEYHGQWACNRRDGQGAELVDGVCVYTGSWQCNERHGQGRGVLGNRWQFTGKWMNGLPSEIGVTIDEFGYVIPGEWQAGKFVQFTSLFPSIPHTVTDSNDIELLKSRIHSH